MSFPVKQIHQDPSEDPSLSKHADTCEAYLANLEMVAWSTSRVLAMAWQLSPAARRLSAYSVGAGRVGRVDARVAGN
jgi:hypothetical protein